MGRRRLGLGRTPRQQVPAELQQARVRAAGGPSPGEWLGLEEVPDTLQCGLLSVPCPLAGPLPLLECRVGCVLPFCVSTHPLLTSCSELSIFRVPALQVAHLPAVLLAWHMLGGDKNLNILYAQQLAPSCCPTAQEPDGGGPEPG